jgi:alpha-L-fucosidase
MSKDLGSRELVARAEGVNWYPSEVDVSIRPGWFYHEWQDGDVRSLANLVDIYYTSVGRNSVLLLNIPPDRRGLIHEIDAERIATFGDYITRNFSKSLIQGRVSQWRANKGDSHTYNVRRGEIVNTILLQEDIRRGQRVEHFTIEAYYNGRWHHITEGTTIGYKRLLRFSDCRAERIRVTIDECRTSAYISNVELYYAEPLKDERRKAVTSDVPTDGWLTVNADTHEAIDAHEAIDGDISTVWRSEGLTSITIDLGSHIDIAGLCYAPPMEGGEGTIFNYNIYVSEDGKWWKQCVTEGEFSNIKNNPIP